MQKIVVIGTGGTGTMLLPQMCRYLNSIAEHTPYGKYITIALIDGDTVEKKNLDRQVFIEDDIGANKALVFAGALAENFSHLRFEGYDRYIDTAEDLRDIAGNISYDEPIFLCCVDNNEARKVITETFKTYENAYLIDGGNDFLDGQTVYAIREKGVTTSPAIDFYYPNQFKKKGKRRSAMSCSELNSAKPQHIAVNSLSAWNMFMGVVRIFEKNPIRGISVFDASKLSVIHEEPEKYGFSVDKEVAEYLKKCSKEKKEGFARTGTFLKYLLNDPDAKDEAEKYLNAMSKKKKKKGGAA